MFFVDLIKLSSYPALLCALYSCHQSCLQHENVHYHCGQCIHVNEINMLKRIKSSETLVFRFQTANTIITEYAKHLIWERERSTNLEMACLCPAVTCYWRLCSLMSVRWVGSTLSVPCSSPHPPVTQKYTCPACLLSK